MSRLGKLRCLTVFELLIVFKDNTKKIIKDVENFGVLFNGETYWFEKHGYKSYCPKEGILFFGRAFDWEN